MSPWSSVAGWSNPAGWTPLEATVIKRVRTGSAGPVAGPDTPTPNLTLGNPPTRTGPGAVRRGLVVTSALALVLAAPSGAGFGHQAAQAAHSERTGSAWASLSAAEQGEI